MNDIFLPEIFLWQKAEDVIRSTAYSFGFSEIRTPIVENTQLFKRGVGEDTDIVEKEMYTFEDRNGDSLSLRPEGTAGVVRAVNEHSLLNDHPALKLYYMGPMFRHERPQKGRYRQFYQFGVEYMGSEHPFSDVEVMYLIHEIFKKLKLDSSIHLHISSVGCDSCRPAYKKLLISKLDGIKDQLPEDVQKRIPTNPQRIFDHKDEKVKKLTQGLPLLLDHLCESCQQHLEGVEKGLTSLGVPYVRDPKIVRGLDYYTQTSFEFITDKLGAQATVCGGGRYNKLVGMLGGSDVPAVGFGMGLERLVLLLEQIEKPQVADFDVMFVYPDEKGLEPCTRLCGDLRVNGIRCEIDYQNRSMKSQIKKADKIGAKFAVIIGGNELEKNVAVIKDMKNHTQEEVQLSQVSKWIATRLGS